jgi:pimeloyl-ACP methyl ester carboxylesterase
VTLDSGSAGTRNVARLAVIAALATVALSIGVALASASGKRPTISPAPGTPDVSPETQISILGVKPHRIRSVRATGSETGGHPGTMRRYWDARGASFIPRGFLSFAWGMRDPVATMAVLEALRELRPTAPVRELAELGHYPQIEDAQAIAACLQGALEHAGVAA